MASSTERSLLKRRPVCRSPRARSAASPSAQPHDRQRHLVHGVFRVPSDRRADRDQLDEQCAGGHLVIGELDVDPDGTVCVDSFQLAFEPADAEQAGHLDPVTDLVDSRVVPRAQHPLRGAAWVDLDGADADHQRHGHVATVEQLAEGDSVEVGHEGLVEVRAARAPDRGADGGELECAADALEVAPDESHADDHVRVEIARLLDDPGQRGGAGGKHAGLEHGVLPVVAPAVAGAHPHPHPPPMCARVTLHLPCPRVAIRRPIRRLAPEDATPEHVAVAPLRGHPVHGRAHHHADRLEAGVVDGGEFGDGEVTGPCGARAAELVDALAGGQGEFAALQGGDALELPLLRRRALLSHQRSSERTILGVSISWSGSLRTAVPMAKNSMVWLPHTCDFSWIWTPTMPSAFSLSASSCMRSMASSRASYRAWVKLPISRFWPMLPMAWNMRW